MGKIRVKTIGLDDLEEDKKKKKQKKEEKKKVKIKGMKGGERVSVVGPSIEELEVEGKKEDVVKTTTAKTQLKKDKKRSSSYKAKAASIDKNKLYKLDEAITLLKKIKNEKFDETVEVHINTTKAGISGTLKLPHGTGKEIKAVVTTDKVLEEIEKGKINFDVLVAEPSMMPRLAKVAKILGPKGLMPNPKNGTISADPEEALKSFRGGKISYKTENKIPVLHVAIGKISFEDKFLADNIKAVITSIKKDNIKKITLSSTMSPGIKIA